MLREASAPSEGEGEAPGEAVLWSDLSGAHRGPGEIPQSTPGDHGRASGTRCPIIPYSVDCLGTHKGFYTLIPESSDYASYMVLKNKIKIPILYL